jgi:hypothetical protein
MTTLPRPGPLDTQDGAGTELDLLWDQMADVVEATEAVANNAMPNTAAAAGALIAGAASKAAPDDADLLGLSDSAAGGVLKYLSWSNIKAALRAVFATLSGVAGGQTLTGGTAASETLTLRSTAHATKGKIQFGSSSAFDEAANDWGFGTTSPSAKVHVVDTAEQLRLGYDAATYLSMTVSDLGAVTYRATGGQYIFKGANATATLGSELVTNGDFTSNLSGWTDSGATWSWVTGSAKHTSGSISNLSQNVTVTSTNTYLIDFTISGRTSGNVTITLGAVTLVDNGATTTWSGNGTNKRTLVAAASGSVALTIVPSSTFDGSIDNISLRVVSLGTVTPTVAVQNSDASAGVHIRSGGNTQWNTFVGIDVGRSILSGYNNSGYGGNALRTINTGLNNTAVGYNALNLCTIGSSNTVVGSGAGYANVSAYGNALFGYISGTALTTGGYNCAYGSNSLIGATIGSYTTAMGYASLTGLTSGNNVTALGAHSGRFIADGATANATCNDSVFVGYMSKALASGQTNQVVVGYNAVGLGSNTSVIGNSSTLTFKAFGTPIFTPAASFTPTTNGELSMEATSNTSVTIKLKGTDGVVRSSVLTLA